MKSLTRVRLDSAESNLYYKTMFWRSMLILDGVVVYTGLTMNYELLTNHANDLH